MMGMQMTELSWSSRRQTIVLPTPRALFPSLLKASVYNLDVLDRMTACRDQLVVEVQYLNRILESSPFPILSNY